MRKIIAVFLSIILVFCITSCGNQGEQKEESILDNPGPATGTVTVSMLGGVKEIQIYDEIFDAFEDANPGIEIETVWYGSFDMLYQDLITSQAPDIITADADIYSGWVQAGAIKSIQPYIDSENYDLTDFWPQLVEISRYDKQTNKKGVGDVYGLPKDYGVTGVFVNVDLLKSSVTKGYITQTEMDRVLDREHPMTFDTYIDIASKLTVKDTNGKITQYGTNTISIESYIWSHGSDYIKDGKYFNADDQVVIDAFQLAADICQPSNPKCCTPTYEDVQSVDNNTLFTSGKTAMIYAGRWYAATYEDVDFEWACIPLPVAEEGQNSISFCSSVLYGISHSSKNNQMAWKVLQFLASKDAYKIMNKLNYAVPARKSLIKDESFIDPKTAGVSKKMTATDTAVFFKIAENAHIHPAYYFSSNRWSTVLTQNSTYVYSGEKTAREMLKDVEQDVNAAIKSANPELFR